MQQTPDDIKIIAQFLAARAGAPESWHEHRTDAFKLRRALRERGQFRLARKIPPAEAR